MHSEFNQRDFFLGLQGVATSDQILRSASAKKSYETGIRIGSGSALAVIVPNTLLQMWRVLLVCVEHDVVTIMQASNTGITAGSTPYGDDYDRPVVIISTRALDQSVLLNKGREVLAFAGATLYSLEDQLSEVDREPHSVIGSSCIGASIIGGICNNSGGSLINRGPAYTELALYARLDESRQLSLVNELGMDLGESPEDILGNLDNQLFDYSPARPPGKLASDTEYQARVRDVGADTPSRYNADPRRLKQASGCAGKLAVFAVRLDTFKKPSTSKVFYIGTNHPDDFNQIRRQALTSLTTLPELAEYMHASFFDASDRYCKDVFLVIKKLGSSKLTKLWGLNAKINSLVSKLKIFPDKFAERIALSVAQVLPDHLPKRVREFRNRFEHHLIIKATDDNIKEIRALLDQQQSTAKASLDYFECNAREAEDALLHRFVAGNAVSRYASIHKKEVSGIAPLDVALRRNDELWMDLPPPEIANKLATPLILSHFFCNVFHLDLVVKKGFDVEQVKQTFLEYLDQRGAKYPAEHNVGHYYQAEPSHQDFYKSLDPCNSFNAGVGKMSKRRNYL